MIRQYLERGKTDVVYFAQKNANDGGSTICKLGFNPNFKLGVIVTPIFEFKTAICALMLKSH